MGTEGRPATSGGGVVRPERIVSGGQSGADRGALEAARQLPAPSQVRHHLASLSTPAVLNVAGPRESESPGVTEAVRRCLLEALGNPAVRGANG
jgi:hypothetical protein